VSAGPVRLFEALVEGGHAGGRFVDGGSVSVVVVTSVSGAFTSNTPNFASAPVPDDHTPTLEKTKS